MPNGMTHTAATLLLAGATLPLANTAITAGVLTGVLVSPDLDVDGGNISLYHLRRVGCIGGVLSGVWRAYWYPYAKLTPHRSHISHSVLFGTMLRVFYLIFPFLVANFFGVPMAIPQWFGMWFLGLCLSDALHILMDWM